MPDPRRVTLLSTPKPFAGHTAVIQRNAITSWTLLRPRPDIILFGGDKGTAEICAELGLRHVPEVATSPEGTPLVSDMFVQGQALASTEMVCWANADIIFTDELLDAVHSVAAQSRPALLVGQRTDIEQRDPMDFGPGWQTRLKATSSTAGERKPCNWIDYFCFTRGLFCSLPPFAIGRPGYDPWLIWHAAELGADVIDATDFVTAVHQRHDYSHVGTRKQVFSGTEAQRNAVLVDDWRQYHSIAHARLKLDRDGRLVPATGWRYLQARPRARVAHALRFTRPLRQRVLGERASWRARLRSGRRSVPMTAGRSG